MKIAVKKFGVFHIFPFSFESEVEFSQELFDNLKRNSEIKGILRMKKKRNDATLKNHIVDPNCCNNLLEYFKRNSRIFSPHYFDQEKNFRLFLPDIKLVDTFGNYKKVSINTLIDKRGFGIINFFIEYIYENPISAEKVLEELYAPHKGHTIIGENAKKLNFEEAFLYYYDKIREYIPRNALKLKDTYSKLTREEIKNYYEPYAFTIIDDFHTEKKIENDSELIMAFLPVLLWEEEKGKIRDYKQKTIESLYKDISHKERYLTLLSRESTLLIDKNGKLPVDSSDVITYSINIEMLMLQKLILILYDHKVDAMLVQLRNKKISPSIIVDFRENVQKDLEDLFDIRIKNYQRGKDIVDIGQKILKLKDFVQEVLSKMNTLDNLIALKHNIYIEQITVVLTLLGLVIVTFKPVLSIIPPAYKNWVYGFYIGIILTASFYYYIRIKRV
jgi:hypothetical protein